MGKNSLKKNLYFYKWDRMYLAAALGSDRVSCNIKDFEYDDNLEDFAKLRNSGVEVFAYLPLLWRENEDFELDFELDFDMSTLDGFYVGNAGQIEWALKTGKPVFGDVGLNVFNAECADFYFKNGLCGCTLSYELDSDVEQIVDALNGENVGGLEVLRYGRVPAMVSEYCLLAGAEGIKGCGCGRCLEHNPVYLRDNMGERYPVMLDDARCTSLILSKEPLNRKNSAKVLRKYGDGFERITVFDESPGFLARI